MHMRRRWIVWCVIALAAILGFMTGCRSRPGPKLPPGSMPKPRHTPDLPPKASKAQREAWRKAQLDEIYTAVLRRGLGEHGPFGIGSRDWRDKLPQRVFFLNLDGKDPTDDFMRRLAGLKPTIMKESQRERYIASIAKDRPRFFGQYARLGLRDLRWESDSRVLLWFSFTSGPRSAFGQQFAVSRKGGTWLVTQVLQSGEAVR